MEWTNKAKAWTALCGAVVATGGAWSIGVNMKAGAEALIAQEAKAVAESVVEKMTAPQTQKLESIEHLLRRQDDRAALAECREFAAGYPAGPVRERRCRAESDYRWEYWAYTDCVEQGGGEVCVEPEPEVSPETRRGP